MVKRLIPVYPCSSPSCQWRASRAARHACASASIPQWDSKASQRQSEGGGVSQGSRGRQWARTRRISGERSQELSCVGLLERDLESSGLLAPRLGLLFLNQRMCPGFWKPGEGAQAISTGKVWSSHCRVQVENRHTRFNCVPPAHRLHACQRMDMLGLHILLHTFVNETDGSALCSGSRIVFSPSVLAACGFLANRYFLPRH